MSKFTLDEGLSLAEAVYQAMGAASVCWDKNGVFDVGQAKEISDALLEFVMHYSHHLPPNWFCFRPRAAPRRESEW